MGPAPLWSEKGHRPFVLHIRGQQLPPLSVLSTPILKLSHPCLSALSTSYTMVQTSLLKGVCCWGVAQVQRLPDVQRHMKGDKKQRFLASF